MVLFSKPSQIYLSLLWSNWLASTLWSMGLALLTSIPVFLLLWEGWQIVIAVKELILHCMESTVWRAGPSQPFWEQRPGGPTCRAATKVWDCFSASCACCDARAIILHNGYKKGLGRRGDNHLILKIILYLTLMASEVCLLFPDPFPSLAPILMMKKFRFFFFFMI